MNNSELYQISELDKSDYYRNFLQLLEQLTSVDADNISYSKFCERFDEKNSKIYVIRNISEHTIVATGSIFIEKKFIHNLGSVAHIEDVVVQESYRGKDFGKTIIDELIGYAKLNSCYKIILNCSHKNIKFYEKCGFTNKEVAMVQYLG